MDEKYILVSIKHTDFSGKNPIFTLWMSDFCGYTENFDKAGLYTKAEIIEHYGKNPAWLKFLDNGEKLTKYNPADTVAVRVDKLEEAGICSKKVILYL